MVAMDFFKVEEMTKEQLEEVKKKIENLDALKPCNETDREFSEQNFENFVAGLSPMEVALKLINAKMWIPEHTALGIKYGGCYSEVFDIEQLREIAAYLTVYCMYNKEEQ